MLIRISKHAKFVHLTNSNAIVIASQIRSNFKEDMIKLCWIGVLIVQKATKKRFVNGFSFMVSNGTQKASSGAANEPGTPELKDGVLPLHYTGIKAV